MTTTSTTSNAIDIIINKHYSTIRSHEWDLLVKAGICNGCGGSGDTLMARFFRWLIRFLLKRLRVIFVEASCMIHDLGYYVGGTEERRKECDVKFLQAILNDIVNIKLRLIFMIGYVLLAFLFYFSVRFGGKYYFNYK